MYELAMGKYCMAKELLELRHEQHEKYMKRIKTETYQGEFVFFNLVDFELFNSEYKSFETDMFQNFNSASPYMWDFKTKQISFLYNNPFVEGTIKPKVTNPETLLSSKEVESIIKAAVSEAVEQAMLKYTEAIKTDSSANSITAFDVVETANDNEDDDFLLTSDQAAELVGCHQSNIYLRTINGYCGNKLPYVQWGPSKSGKRFVKSILLKHFENFPLKKNATKYFER
jgi:hypothetical protein